MSADGHPDSWSKGKVMFWEILHLSEEDQDHAAKAVYGGADSLCATAGGSGNRSD